MARVISRKFWTPAWMTLLVVCMLGEVAYFSNKQTVQAAAAGQSQAQAWPKGAPPLTPIPNYHRMTPVPETSVLDIKVPTWVKGVLLLPPGEEVVCYVPRTNGSNPTLTTKIGNQKKVYHQQSDFVDSPWKWLMNIQEQPIR